MAVQYDEDVAEPEWMAELNALARAGDVFVQTESPLGRVRLRLSCPQVGGPQRIVLQKEAAPDDPASIGILIRLPSDGAFRYKKMWDKTGGIVLTLEHLLSPDFGGSLNRVHFSNRTDFLSAAEYEEDSKPRVQ